MIVISTVSLSLPIVSSNHKLLISPVPLFLPLVFAQPTTGNPRRNKAFSKPLFPLFTVPLSLIEGGCYQSKHPATYFNPHLPMEGDCLPGGSTAEFFFHPHHPLKNLH